MLDHNEIAENPIPLAFQNSLPPVPGELEIRVLGEGDSLWQVIDDDAITFSIYHTYAWKTLVEKIFGHRACYLAAIRHGDLVDVLPLFRIHKPILGTKILSTPYEGCHGGFISNDDEAKAGIIRQAIEIGRSSKALTVEIRHAKPIPVIEDHGFAHSSPFLISQLGLKDTESNWNMLSAKHRRNVRLSRKRGVTVREASTIQEMRRFYTLITRHYKNLGVPYPGPSYFDEIWNSLVQSRRAALHLAVADDEIIGGHLLFRSGRTLISKYSAHQKDSVARSSYASYLLNWEAVVFGIENGHQSLNMGITGSENTGLIEFKNRFGCTSAPIHFYHYPIRGRIPDYKRLYDGHQFLKKMWRYLPDSFAQKIGHQINQWIC